MDRATKLFPAHLGTALCAGIFGIATWACVPVTRGEPQPPAATEQTPATVGGRAGSGAALAGVKNSLVLVAIRFNGEIHGVPGVVFDRSGDQALVAARISHELRQAYTKPGGLSSGPDYFVLWGENTQRKAVPAERLSPADRNPLCVIGAPADKLPPPIKSAAGAAVKSSLPVYVIGFETDRTVTPATFAAFTEKGTLSQVTHDEQGHVRTVAVRSPETPQLAFAVVTTESGGVIGFSRGEPFRGSARVAVEYSVSPLTALQDLLEPQVSQVTFGYASGDAEQIVHEFIAVINDPGGRVGSLRLSIQPEAPAKPRVEHAPNEESRHRRPAPRTWTNELPDAVTLDLRKQRPSDAVLRQLPHLRQYGDGATWVAHHPSKNPGYKQEHSYYVQLSYQDGSGTTVYLPPQTLRFVVWNRNPEHRPPIPGLDGKPLDYPRATQLADGSHRLTSETTRVKAVQPAVDAAPPAPVNSGKSLAGKLTPTTRGAVLELEVSPLCPQSETSLPNVPAVFSPDGDWLYLIDAKSVLRKINTRDFQEVSYLGADARFSSLAYSRAGLMLAVPSVDAVWVVDPDSLKIKRAIPAEGLQTVVASPVTDIGFSVGRVARKKERTPIFSSSYAQLLLMDLEKGSPLHRIEDRYDLTSSSAVLLAFGKQALFPNNGFDFAHLSANGETLFVTGKSNRNRLCQFRVEGEDLLFQRIVPLTSLAFSDDRIAARRSYGNKFSIYDLAEPDQPKFDIDVGPVGPVAFDPKSGEIYVVAAGSLHVFDPVSGKEIAAIKVPDSVPTQLIPHPGGNRLLGWGQNKVVFYDFKPGRLSGNLGP